MRTSGFREELERLTGSYVLPARIVDDNLTVADLHSRAFRRVKIMLDINASSDSTGQYHKLAGESWSR